MFNYISSVTSESLTTTMPGNESSNALDGDVILRILGPPERKFRTHKLLLSLASPVFRDMFSLPQPTTPDSGDGNVADIVQVTDPPHALGIVLGMIHPDPSPSLDGNLDTLIECLIIAQKYEMKGAISQLHYALSQANASLRVYAIAYRFGFANLAESTYSKILPSVDLAGISLLPDDFKFVPATAYHKLVRRRACYLEAVVEVIQQTSLQVPCAHCRRRPSTTEAFRSRLTHLITTGTRLEGPACLWAWAKAYGSNTDCEENCVARFIHAAISRVNKVLVISERPTQRRKSALKT